MVKRSSRTSVWALPIAMVFVILGCGSPPKYADRRRPARAETGDVAEPADTTVAEPETPKEPEKPKEPEEPEPPAGPAGSLIVHTRGDVGVTVFRKGQKVAEGKAIIPIKLDPAHYTVTVHPPGLPEADLGKVTVFSEKIADVEVVQYGEIWIHSAKPGEPAELVGADGANVAAGKTGDFWLVPVGEFKVKALGQELANVKVEPGKMTAVRLGK